MKPRELESKDTFDLEADAHSSEFKRDDSVTPFHALTLAYNLPGLVLSDAKEDKLTSPPKTMVSQPLEIKQVPYLPSPFANYAFNQSLSQASEHDMLGIFALLARIGGFSEDISVLIICYLVDKESFDKEPNKFKNLKTTSPVQVFSEAPEILTFSQQLPSNEVIKKRMTKLHQGQVGIYADLTGTKNNPTIHLAVTVDPIVGNKEMFTFVDYYNGDAVNRWLDQKPRVNHNVFVYVNDDIRRLVPLMNAERGRKVWSKRPTAGSFCDTVINRIAEIIVEKAVTSDLVFVLEAHRYTSSYEDLSSARQLIRRSLIRAAIRYIIYEEEKLGIKIPRQDVLKNYLEDEGFISSVLRGTFSLHDHLKNDIERLCRDNPKISRKLYVMLQGKTETGWIEIQCTSAVIQSDPLLMQVAALVGNGSFQPREADTVMQWHNELRYKHVDVYSRMFAYYPDTNTDAVNLNQVAFFKAGTIHQFEYQPYLVPQDRHISFDIQLNQVLVRYAVTIPPILHLPSHEFSTTLSEQNARTYPVVDAAIKWIDQTNQLFDHLDVKFNLRQLYARYINFPESFSPKNRLFLRKVKFIRELLCTALNNGQPIQHILFIHKYDLDEGMKAVTPQKLLTSNQDGAENKEFDSLVKSILTINTMRRIPLRDRRTLILSTNFGYLIDPLGDNQLIDYQKIPIKFLCELVRLMEPIDWQFVKRDMLKEFKLAWLEDGAEIFTIPLSDGSSYVPTHDPYIAYLVSPSQERYCVNWNTVSPDFIFKLYSLINEPFDRHFFMTMANKYYLHLIAVKEYFSAVANDIVLDHDKQDTIYEETSIHPESKKTINKIHADLLKLNRSFINDPLTDQVDREAFSALNDILTRDKSKLRSLVNFQKSLQCVSQNNIRRSHTWDRYLADALSILFVLPALYRACVSYHKYNTFRFWQPEKARVCRALNARVDNFSRLEMTTRGIV